MKAATKIQRIMYRNSKTGVLAALPSKEYEIVNEDWNFDLLEITAKNSSEQVQSGEYIPIVAQLKVELISSVDKKVIRKQKLTDEVFTFMRGNKIYNYKNNYYRDWETNRSFNDDHYATEKSLLKAFSDDRKYFNSNGFKNTIINHRYFMITKGTEEERKKSFFGSPNQKNEDVPIYIVKVTRENGEYKILDKKPLSDFPEILI